MSINKEYLQYQSCLSCIIGSSITKSFLVSIRYRSRFQINKLIPKIILRIFGHLSYRKPSIFANNNSGNFLENPGELEPGDWVEVLSFEEILTTLNSRGINNGLEFMAEMKKYCGKRFRVYKNLKIIKIESTGEIRKIENPTVLLEGVFCDGEQHDGCDRACFHYWRESWLKKISYD